MPRRSYFTVAEVERMIPKLEQIVTRVMQLRGALRTQEQRLEAAGVRITRDLLEQETGNDRADIKHAKVLFRGYYEALSDALGEIGALGGEVKDLEIGLCDFPGKRNGEDILLCWKLGEKSVDFWHTPDAGYAGRKPIDDQVPREPQRLD